jgi:hypothetical protein
MQKYFWRIVRQQINTFDVFSDYDKIVLATSLYSHNEIRIRKSKVTLSTLSSGFKGTV